jgi:hypothetical protein
MPEARRGTDEEARKASPRGYRPKKIPERFKDEDEPGRVPPGAGPLSDQQSEPTGTLQLEQSLRSPAQRIDVAGREPLVLMDGAAQRRR